MRAGTIIGVYVCRDKVVSTRTSEINLQFGGIADDRHFGWTKPAGVREPYHPKGTQIHNFRQISIVSSKELEQISSELGVHNILPEWLGANICVSGIDNLTQTPPMSRFLFPSGASILIYGENDPCVHPGKVIAREYNRPELKSQFVKAAMHRRGVVGWVERPGIIESSLKIYLATPDEMRKTRKPAQFE